MRVFALCLLSALCGCLTAGRTPTSGDRGLTVAELERLGTRAGEYLVDGYLVSLELCPPCPKDAACEPCRDNNLAISDDPTLLEGYATPGRGRVLLDPVGGAYVLGRRYRWMVVIPKHAPLSGFPPRIGYAQVVPLAEPPVEPAPGGPNP